MKQHLHLSRFGTLFWVFWWIWQDVTLSGYSRNLWFIRCAVLFYDVIISVIFWELKFLPAHPYSWPLPKVKIGKISAQFDWLPQAPNSLCITLVGRIPLSYFSWGIKEMGSGAWDSRVRKFQNKVGLKGCKWSSLNAPGTKSPLHHSGWQNN